MIDREKVIKGLEIQLDDLQKYADATELLTLTQEHAKEILALLKDYDTQLQYCDDHITMYQTEIKRQDEKIKELQSAYDYLQKQFFEVQDKLLKEQEAVEPKQIGQGWFCGACDALLSIGDEKIVKFCSMCGKPIKWE